MFTITIVESKEVKKTLPKVWAKIGQEENKSVFNDERVWVSDKMGYTPETETLVTDTKKLYEQTVDQLDLRAVIATINKII